MSVSLKKLRDLASLCRITEYEDYRDYLEAVYQTIKAQASEYSYAHFSISLGLSSTNAHAVIVGHRDLSQKIGLRVALALGLSESHKRYFLALIRQEHAKSPLEREMAFKERLELKRASLPTRLDGRRLKFFESWHNAAIIELLRLEGASDAPQWISQTLRPEISVPTVKKSLKLLTELGYLAFDKKRGRLFPTEVSISTGDQVERLAILSYHRQMINLAISAMDQIDARDRDISTITVGVSAALKKQMQDEIVALRKKFLELASAEINPEEIIQVNMQIFPVSRGVKK